MGAHTRMEATSAPAPGIVNGTTRKGDFPSSYQRPTADTQTHADFREVYEHHAPRIYRYLCRRLGDESLAEDVLHDVFVIVMRKIDSFSPRAGIPIEHWLLRIATNAANRALRKNSREKAQVPRAEEPSIVHPNDADSQLIGAIQQLPRAQQTALVLHYIEGLSVEQVAHVVRCRVGTVKSRLHRARRNLRTYLETPGEVRHETD